MAAAGMRNDNSSPITNVTFQTIRHRNFYGGMYNHILRPQLRSNPTITNTIFSCWCGGMAITRSRTNNYEYDLFDNTAVLITAAV
jgi:hypothetical protein